MPRAGRPAVVTRWSSTRNASMFGRCRSRIRRPRVGRVGPAALGHPAVQVGPPPAWDTPATPCSEPPKATSSRSTATAADGVGCSGASKGSVELPHRTAESNYERARFGQERSRPGASAGGDVTRLLRRGAGRLWCLCRCDVVRVVDRDDVASHWALVLVEHGGAGEIGCREQSAPESGSAFARPVSGATLQRLARGLAVDDLVPAGDAPVLRQAER